MEETTRLPNKILNGEIDISELSAKIRESRQKTHKHDFIYG